MQSQGFKPNLISINLCKTTLCISDQFLSFQLEMEAKFPINGTSCQSCSSCKEVNLSYFFSFALKLHYYYFKFLYVSTLKLHV